ncbi:peptidase, M23 family [Desulfococcus multivorans]|nr:peptidase, M23 family [Desulfococcus multivorans]
MKDKMKTLKNRIFLITGILLLAGLGVFLYFKLEGSGPTVTIQGLEDTVQASNELDIRISDPRSGIRSITITLEKDGKKVVLFDETYPAINIIAGGKVSEKDLAVTIEPQKHGFSDGNATLHLTARDYAWRSWWHGNKTVLEKSVLIDSHPPRIEVLSRQHNINQGGAGLVVYRLSEPCLRHGVQVGDNFFQGYPLADDKNNRLVCLFALDYRQGKETPVSISAADRAGNISKAGFYHHIRSKTFKTDLIQLSDNFLAQKMPEFDDSLFKTPPTSPVDKFLAINREIRSANAQEFQRLSSISDGTIRWDNAFLRLPNAARKASFADHRDYRYQGETIDRQVHLGIDLASLAHAPVPAGNTGKVVFAGPIGIYGETVVIDHGIGLFSTYSHMNSIQVQPNQMVNRGDIIGTTGTTGLAGGDHLHYGMLVGGVFVNPVEWWDPEWIRNNITLRIDTID